MLIVPPSHLEHKVDPVENLKIMTFCLWRLRIGSEILLNKELNLKDLYRDLCKDDILCKTVTTCHGPVKQILLVNEMKLFLALGTLKTLITAPRASYSENESSD